MPNDFMKESDIPPEWVPVTPSGPGAVPPPHGPAPDYIQGTLAANLQHDSSLVATQYRGAGVPVTPLMPIGTGLTAQPSAGMQGVANQRINSMVSKITATPASGDKPGVVTVTPPPSGGGGGGGGSINPPSRARPTPPEPREPIRIFGAENLNQIDDGSTYGRTLQTALTSGSVDLSKSGVISKTLTNISDGTSRFGQTAAGTSYRPLTNALTAADAGASATISVASNSIRVAGKSDVSNNSGSIASLSYDTTYYVYEDDPTLAGGAVTYAATTTKETALNNAGRFFIGSIITPISTGVSTIGNNDGGSGAQTGQTITAQPGANAGGGVTITNPTFAYDNDTATFANISRVASGAGTTSLTYSSFPGLNLGQTSLVLKIVSERTTSAAAVVHTIEYSIDSGTTYTTIRTGTTLYAKVQDNTTLPARTNLGQLFVRIKGVSDGTGGTAAQIRTYEIWVTEAF